MKERGDSRVSKREPVVSKRPLLGSLALLCGLVAFVAVCRTSTSTSDGNGNVTAIDSSLANPGAASAVPVFRDARLFVTQDSPFREQAVAWRRNRPADAAIMDALASRAQAIWLGEWNENVSADVAEIMQLAATDESVPVFVIYFIPLRDCGSYSKGGAVSADFYREWIGRIEGALGGGKAAVILEPDALAGMECLTPVQRSERIALIRHAVETFSRHPHISVYIDAGNARWKEPEEMAAALKSVNVDVAAGFALNISNFITTDETISYGEKLSAAVGGKHFLIDTSRNGLGPTADLAWCNPPGRGLGVSPTTKTGHELVDALLWIKRPGESDGECNGGPAAGVWWPEYVLAMARRSSL